MNNGRIKIKDHRMCGLIKNATAAMIINNTIKTG